MNTRIVVGQGSCGLAAGAGAVYSALEAKMTGVNATLGITGCIGICYLEPIVDVYADEKLYRCVKVTAEDADLIIDAVSTGDYSKLDPILIQAEDPSNADSMAAAKVRAEDLYAQWQADPTEDNFINMAGTHTEDPGSQGTGGLYEDIYPGQMVTNFNDWCFDEARQPGDHGIVETEYGYHIMYFVGDSEKPYADPNATVANEKYNAKLEALFTQEEPENLTENAVFTAKPQ